MDKYKRVEQLKELKDNGSITDEEFNKEKEKILNSNGLSKGKIILIIAIISIVAIISFLIIYFFVIKPNNISTPVVNNNTSKEMDESTKNKETVENKNIVSFSNMNSDDKQYNEIQQYIIDYFDYDYFNCGSKSLQRYPQLFTNAKIQGYGIVMKVLESNEEEFKVVVAEGGEPLYTSDGSFDFYDRGLKNKNVSDANENILYILQGKQLEQNLLKRR